MFHLAEIPRSVYLRWPRDQSGRTKMRRFVEGFESSIRRYPVQNRKTLVDGGQVSDRAEQNGLHKRRSSQPMRKKPARLPARYGVRCATGRTLPEDVGVRSLRYQFHRTRFELAIGCFIAQRRIIGKLRQKVGIEDKSG